MPIDVEPLSPEHARAMLEVAVAEARIGLAEGGVPVGAAVFTREGTLLGAGRNRRVQHGDASAHGETDAFRAAGRRRHYRDCVMVTTLSPCWYCAGLVRQFDFGAIVIGEATNFTGAHAWLTEVGVEVVILDDPTCTSLLRQFIGDQPELWDEDIGR